MEFFKMRYKVLGVSTEKAVNIGDYIQALAPAQFLPSLDGYVQREELKQYEGENCKMVMNGWYMHHTENWPPSDKIDPLFVAFHMNSLARKELLGKESLDYLKRNEPIGCRDILTAELLNENGIDAYFSGCMTLTLGYKYKDQNKDDKCYFVDPFFETKWNLFTIMHNFLSVLWNWKNISIIASKYPMEKKGLRKKMILATFYREYSKIFSKETLLNAEYINQQSAGIKSEHASEEEYLNESERLVKKYAKAKLVVTSRIHCALPCLGMETPVIYIEDEGQSEASACRLNGLRELFTIINWSGSKLKKKFEIAGLISTFNFPENKDNWRPIADELISKCKKFVSN
jgi:hypothetical protein